MQARTASSRLDAAIDSAEDALTLSRVYSANMRRMIIEAERDVTRVGYLNTLRLELAAARKHLERRIHVDGLFLRHLENVRADASEEQDPVAVRQLTRADEITGRPVLRGVGCAGVRQSARHGGLDRGWGCGFRASYFPDSAWLSF